MDLPTRRAIDTNEYDLQRPMSELVVLVPASFEPKVGQRRPAFSSPDHEQKFYRLRVFSLRLFVTREITDDFERKYHRTGSFDSFFIHPFDFDSFLMHIWLHPAFSMHHCFINNIHEYISCPGLQLKSHFAIDSIRMNFSSFFRNSKNPQQKIKEKLNSQLISMNLYFKI